MSCKEKSINNHVEDIPIWPGISAIMRRSPSGKQEINLFSMSNSLTTDLYLIDSTVFLSMEESAPSKIGFMITKENKGPSIKVKLFRSSTNSPKGQGFMNLSEFLMDKML